MYIKPFFPYKFLLTNLILPFTSPLIVDTFQLMPVYPDSFGLRGLQIAGLWDASDKYPWEFYNQIIKTKDVDRVKAIAMSQYFDLQVFKCSFSLYLLYFLLLLFKMHMMFRSS